MTRNDLEGRPRDSRKAGCLSTTRIGVPARAGTPPAAIAAQGSP